MQLFDQKSLIISIIDSYGYLLLCDYSSWLNIMTLNYNIEVNWFIAEPFETIPIKRVLKSKAQYLIVSTWAQRGIYGLHGGHS